MKKTNSVKLKKTQTQKEDETKQQIENNEEETSTNEENEETPEDDEDDDIEEDSEDEEELEDDEEADESESSKEEEKQTDYFWMKALITMIVVIWIALFAGSWAGNYMLESKLFSKKNHSDDQNKPKVWKTIISDDNTKTVVPVDNTDELKIDDYKNTDEPIPGIDDQSLKTLQAKDLMIQEPIPEEKTEVNTSTTYTRVPVESGYSKPENQTEQASVPEIKHPPLEEENQNIEENNSENTNAEQPASISGTTLKPPAGSYNIQIGSFEKEENAGRIADELKSKGHETVIERVRQDGEDIFKVKIIEKDSHESALKKVEGLKNEGYDAYVVPR